MKREQWKSAKRRERQNGKGAGRRGKMLKGAGSIDPPNRASYTYTPVKFVFLFYFNFLANPPWTHHYSVQCDFFCWKIWRVDQNTKQNPKLKKNVLILTIISLDAIYLFVSSSIFKWHLNDFWWHIIRVIICNRQKNTLPWEEGVFKLWYEDIVYPAWQITWIIKFSITLCPPLTKGRHAKQGLFRVESIIIIKIPLGKTGVNYR